MKNRSIRFKLTLWFSVILIVVVGLTFLTIRIASGMVLRGAIRDYLFSAVEENANKIAYAAADKAVEGNVYLPYGEGTLEIDEDFVERVNDVHVALYKTDGTLLYGENRISRQTGTIPFSESHLWSLDVKSVQYELYDRKVGLTLPDGESLWLRGIVPETKSSFQLAEITRVSLFLLPILIVLSMLSGYVLADRMLSPIRKIEQTASKISKGDDLKQRISAGKNYDEVGRLAEVFNRMFDRLDQAFEAERQFTSDVSHELRTPTSVILAQCEYTLEKARSAEEYEEALQVVYQQGKRMHALVGDMLAYTRMEQRPEQYPLEPLDASQVILEVSQQMALLGHNGITLKTEVEPGIVIESNRQLLTHIVQNLVSNAYRYGKENGHIVVAFHAAQAETGGQGILLSVQDDGIGIAKEEQAKIFDRFYRSDASRSIQGTGLGLSMVKAIAQMHGATVFVDSELGRGSTFYVLFPYFFDASNVSLMLPHYNEDIIRGVIPQNKGGNEMKKWKRAIIALAIVAGIAALGGGSVYAAGQVARSNAITPAAAQNFAFVDAGVQASDVTGLKTEFDYDDGVFVYEVEFIANGIEYDYVIDSASGRILEKEQEPVRGGSQGTRPSQPATAAITLDQAKAIALKQAGRTEGEVVFIKTKLEWDDGRLVYDLEFFVTGQVEYDYDIDASTGAVLKAKQNNLAAVNPGGNPSGNTISVDQAKSIALQRAGRGAGDVVFSKAKLEWDDGRQIYDIEFYVIGQMEYEYEIDAITGAVLEAKQEPWDADDHGGTQSGGTQTGGQTSAAISLDQAKSIALQRAGRNAGDVVFSKAKLEWDDGRQIYDIEFYVIGQVEYEYEIDATTGAVLAAKQEPWDADDHGGTQSGGTQTGGQTSAAISLDQAKSIALQRAGRNAGDVVFSKAKLERDNGRLIYDIEFYVTGQVEYEYEIDATTGAVLEAKQERWDAEDHVGTTARFYDVTKNAWFLKAVDYVVSKGVMNGVNGSTFAPDLPTNRAMLVVMLHRMEGTPAATGNAVFLDVSEFDWFDDAVDWAEENGIVNGLSQVSFGPLEPVTREQLATILQRYADYKGYNTAQRANLLQYKDIGSISGWAMKSVRWANYAGLLNGRTNATIVPGGQSTRAETATVLMRFLEQVAK